MRAHLFAFCLLPFSLLAQSNAVPGLDVSTYDIGDATVFGRRGLPFPNGEVGINLGHSMCNSGTTLIPWVGTSGGVMVPTFPRIASLLARESGGRMVQVSGKSFCKHSRIAFNFSGGPCGPCQSGPSQTWRPTCSDVYSSGWNSSGTLGPTTEIDPWLGTWDPVGSYFDRGDPEVAPPANTDGILSPISWGNDPIKNRMIVAETDLDAPGAVFWGQVWISVIGESGDNRSNNATTRQAVFTRSGTTFSGVVTGSPIVAPVLTRWTGASTALGRNGYDDGHFMVGVKVTGPVQGMWHYEYAIHNLDNHRGGAAFRIPICSTARVENVGFRDIDRNPLNEWQFSRTANELSWLAPAGNPHDWNTIYNVWFDSDAAPIAGMFAIDQARIGPGLLSVAVQSSVPGQLWHEYLGAGCGAPSTTFAAVGQPTLSNPSYALRVQGAPSSLALLVLTFAGSNTLLGNGCTQWIDTTQLAGTLVVSTDATGSATWSLPIPASFPPLDLYGQAAMFVPGGPVLGELVLSSALRVRVGGIGCP